jgi:hypothetical protein
MRNNVLAAAASNIDGFLWRDTRVSPMQLNRIVGNQMSLSFLDNGFTGSTPFKN